MQEGAEGLDNNVGIEVVGTSTEDEKEVNSKKLKQLFLDNLRAMLEDDAFQRWQLEVSDDKKTLTMKEGDQSVQFQYQADGFSVTMNEVTNNSTDLLLHTLSAYQNAYGQIHPKTEITFELTCNDEQEAKAIIKRALKMNPPVHITQLKFYNQVNPDAQPSNEQEILSQIHQDLKKQKPKSKK